MLQIDFDAFRRELNQDAEFGRAGRYWDARIRLQIGERAVLLRIRDGALEEIADCRNEDSCDLNISAPRTDWEKILVPEPRPMYHSLYAATLHHDFAMTGDLVSSWAYSQALVRAFDVMRRHSAVS